MPAGRNADQRIAQLQEEINNLRNTLQQIKTALSSMAELTDFTATSNQANHLIGGTATSKLSTIQEHLHSLATDIQSVHAALTTAQKQCNALITAKTAEIAQARNSKDS